MVWRSLAKLCRCDEEYISRLGRRGDSGPVDGTCVTMLRVGNSMIPSVEGLKGGVRMGEQDKVGEGRKTRWVKEAKTGSTLCIMPRKAWSRSSHQR